MCCLTQIHPNTFSTNDLHSLTSGPEREGDTKSCSCTRERQSNIKAVTCGELVLSLQMSWMIVPGCHVFYSLLTRLLFYTTLCPLCITKEPEMFTGLLWSVTDPHTIILFAVFKHKMMELLGFFPSFFYSSSLKVCGSQKP